MPAPTSSQPASGAPSDARPSSAIEKERFSSGGRPYLLILRGKWGLAVDKAIVWTTGWSLVTAQYAWANGASYTPTLMLYTIGARTGAPRSACLPYFRVGDDYVLRGSNGGGPTDPHWVHNVRANPKARVRIARRTRAMHAHVAQGEEWERLYVELCRQSRSTKAYQDMCAPRQLPLVVLRDEAQAAR
ncbi:nitroreductase family deazaflavin-dependent oxidoreductase [Myxococcota bacterium]|nr:nitroreductase family deazaflavin-dependent oxidoreductase [Myxococcota bacterium]